MCIRDSEEVFLPQAQFATSGGRIVWIKNTGNVLEPVLEFGGARVVAGVEGVEVDPVSYTHLDVYN